MVRQLIAEEAKSSAEANPSNNHATPASRPLSLNVAVTDDGSREGEPEVLPGGVEMERLEPVVVRLDGIGVTSGVFDNGSEVVVMSAKQLAELKDQGLEDSSLVLLDSPVNVSGWHDGAPGHAITHKIRTRIVITPEQGGRELESPPVDVLVDPHTPRPHLLLGRPL